MTRPGAALSSTPPALVRGGKGSGRSGGSALDSLAQAQALYQGDRLAEAVVAYGQVLRSDAHSFGALHGLGLIALRQGRLADGAALLRRAVQSDGRHADAWLNLSRAALMTGDADTARQAAQQALRLRPNDPAAHLAQAAAGMAGQPVEVSLRLLQEVVQAHPGHPDGWSELGSALRGLGRLDEALNAFRRALQVDPDHRAALHGFAQGLMQQDRFEDAALVYERIVQRWPDSAASLGHLLHCKQMMCDWLEHGPLRRRIEAEIAAGHPAAEPFGLQGWCTSPALARQAAELYVNAFWPDRSAGRPKPTLNPLGERIRIGYVSGEFRQQATSVLLTELLELHDRSRFEIVAFDNGWADDSALRRRIEATVDALVPIAELDAEPAAEAVRSHRIDILVDLNGFFGRARTDVFSLRPAAVQVNYLGFPGTMGAPYLDYLVADAETVPPGAEGHYREAVVRLPHCYQPNDRQRPIDAAPITRADVGLPEHAFVFACFNNTYKLTPEVFAVWARLLKQVPGSVLWFFGWVPAAADHLARACEAHGLEPQRIVAAPFWPQARHLARLPLADLFLDTFPYNAHTTGSDALWAGLPVLTCRGDTFPSRVGASLLRAVGLPELICESLGEYEQRALALARDRTRLEALRLRLQSRRTKAPLFDTPRYARELEAAYTQMVERARAGLAPLGFDVKPKGS